MTSELSKYLNEQLGVFLNVKLKEGFLSKNLFVQCNILSNVCYLSFWNFLTFSFKFHKWYQIVEGIAYIVGLLLGIQELRLWKDVSWVLEFIQFFIFK